MEVQEIKINGVTYIPIDFENHNNICVGCALHKKCGLISIPELDGEVINPCGLFDGKMLKVKEK